MDKTGCGAPFNEVAQYFNLGLKKVVSQLRKKLPLAAITYVDVFSVKYKLISQARKHGEDKFDRVKKKTQVLRNIAMFCIDG